MITEPTWEDVGFTFLRHNPNYGCMLFFNYTKSNHSFPDIRLYELRFGAKNLLFKLVQAFYLFNKRCLRRLVIGI
jgi:hypothetical protein